MAQATFAGHPLHPQLIPLPVALLPTSLTFDLAYRATRRRAFADAAYYTMGGAVATGAAAAAAGVVDYLAIESKTHPKRVANIHALLNVGVLTTGMLSLAARRRRHTSTRALALSALANGLAVVSAWYGGHLVYSHGMRVQGVNPIANSPELKLPGDNLLAEPLRRAEELVPDVGPEIGQADVREPIAAAHG